MTVTPISHGEASDLRLRLSQIERDQADFETKITLAVSMHEQKCAFRFTLILVCLAISIGLNIPAAAPHLITLVRMLG